MTFITKEDLEGITYGPIEIADFLDSRWITLHLPNGWRDNYCDPASQYFFDTPQYRGDIIERIGSTADLHILHQIIQKWQAKVNAEILAIVIFGSSVRIPKTIQVSKGMLWKKRLVDQAEEIHPNDVDVLVITANEIENQRIAYFERKSESFRVSDGSCSYTHVMTIMGFDVNHLSLDEYTQLLGNTTHECQIPNNVLKEGVLIAGHLPDLASPRKVTWNKTYKTCKIK